MPDGKLWTQRDRFGNDIYLTHERWAHIIDPDNHPELEPYLDHLRETIRLGRRRQDPYDPQSYLYYRPFLDLPDDNTRGRGCEISMGHRPRWNGTRRKVCEDGILPDILR